MALPRGRSSLQASNHTSPVKIIMSDTKGEKKGQSAGVKLKLLLLLGMVAQNSMTVLVGRYTRSSAPKEDLYVVNHLLIVTELVKFFLAALLEYHMTSGKLWKSIEENVFDRPLDCLKIAIPSLLYLIQNTLLYLALSNLSAPLFQVTYQSKLLTTALVSVLMLNRKYSLQQWVCLTLLGVGVAIVVLGESKKDEPSETESNTESETENNTDGNNGMQEQSMSVGVIAVTIACVSSALAGVYFEKVLKKTTTAEVGGKPQAPVSLWMRNIQMAFFSVCIALVQYMTSKPTSDDELEKPFMHGFTGWVYCLVGLQAGGGILVAAVIKYADNVLKGLATGVSVVVATGCSMALFGTPLTTQFTMGASIILTSVYFFSNEIACLSSSKNNKTSKDGAEMMKPILPR
mmetsp:Transcript_28633/g.52322  ORF Transcript_28633/g.52322 Transcript_28633/m.52322 type:complete len:403 (-) Transcript_28633:198-1406(-)